MVNIQFFISTLVPSIFVHRFKTVVKQCVSTVIYEQIYKILHHRGVVLQGLDDPLSHVDGACKHCGGKLVNFAIRRSPAGRTKVIPTIPVLTNQGTSAVALTEVVTLLWIF